VLHVRAPPSGRILFAYVFTQNTHQGHICIDPDRQTRDPTGKLAKSGKHAKTGKLTSTPTDKLAKTGKSAKTGKLDDLRDKTSHEIERQRGKEAKRQSTNPTSK